MVDYKYKDLFYKRNIDKQLKITTDDGSFAATNSDINWENFELEESLCSESELRFGRCETSVVKFQIKNAFLPLIGKWLTVSETLAGNEDVPFVYGRYKVFSDVPTADKEYRDITAYDAMYDIIGADVADWYNTLLPDKDRKVTMKQFRQSFMAHFGLEWVDPVLSTDSAGNAVYGLVNDDMTVEKTIEPSEISGKDVITSICEINACFGHIGRDGKFHFIYLPQEIQGLYPANDLYPDHAPDYLPYQQKTGHLYPQEPKTSNLGKGSYIKCQYEDFLTKSIDRLQIRQEENDIGCVYGEGSNCYIIQDNFLVYGKSAEELEQIAGNIFEKITNIVYRPVSLLEAVGNPCLEVGEPIRANTKYAAIETYILKRTLKGVQALRDNISASGILEYGEKVNSVAKSIIQLKGKTNTLTRTVEENRLEVKDIEKNLQSEITQNANEIALRVRKDNVIASINLSPEAITLQANRIDLKGLVNADELVSKFATISTLNATTASLNNVIATKASISDLNATNAEIENLKVNKLSVSQFNADTISAMNITVQSANVTGGFSASKITSGTISADRIDINSLVTSIVNTNAFNGASIVTNTIYANTAAQIHGTLRVDGGINFMGYIASWKSATLDDGTTINYLGR